MSSTPHSASAADRRILLAAGAASLAPLGIFFRDFRELFWFGDEWDLLNEIDRTGFWPWTVQVFAENFVPLFKVLWGGAAQVGGGSYLLMLALLWLTHAANTVLLGRVLRAAGAGWFATLLALGLFSLTPGNLETLGWTVQWSAVLATTFLLLGLDLQQRAAPTAGWRHTLALTACAAGSALCFSRGVLTGGVLAAGSLLRQCDATSRAPWSRILGRVAAGILPAVGVAALILGLSSGNHQHPGGYLAEMFGFGLAYFCLNPLYRLLELDSFGPFTTAALGLLKVALIVSQLRRQRGALRRLLVLLVLFDLGNAALLGVGRFHTGLEAALSSRYQYGSLLATLPFAALLLDSWLARLPARLVRPVAAAVLLGLIWREARHWPTEVHGFCAERGTTARRLVFGPEPPAPAGAMPGIPSLTGEHARELTRRFGLH